MRNVLGALALLLAPTLALATQYAKVAIVSQAGGDYTSPVAAMNDVPAWCGTPGPANGCLVKIMPGTYDLGDGVSGKLAMRSYVDVEGSGANVTTLKVGAPGPTTVVVEFSNVSNTELRSLSVENTSGGTDVYGVYSFWSSVAVRDVVVRVSSGAERNKAILVGSYSNQPVVDVVLDRVTVSATGTGANLVTVAVEAGYANLLIDDCSLVATGGVTAYGVGAYSYSKPGTTLNILNTTVRASAAAQNIYALFAKAARTVSLRNVELLAEGGNFSLALAAADNAPTLEGTTVRVDGSRLAGEQAYGVDPKSSLYMGSSRLEGVVPSLVNVRCAQSYDGAYLELGPGCQPLP